MMDVNIIASASLPVDLETKRALWLSPQDNVE